MEKKQNKSKSLISLLLVAILILGVFLPLTQASSNIDRVTGFEKGPSYTNVVPTKKTTFVGFDEDTYLDDYAYLAAVPTAVFKDDGKLISHPLLFYKEKIDDVEDKYKTLDAYEGIKYFMEDWIAYCNGPLDQMTLINVPKSDVDQWDAKEYVEIEDDNPYDIASKIALQDWSYSKNAVVAVIGEDFKKSDEKTSNRVESTLPRCDIYKEPTFTVEQTNSLNPVTENFKVGEEYVYLKAEAWWDGVLIGGNMVPTGDPDLQLYCKTDNGWMQSVATAAWNIYSPAGHEYTNSYIYQPGDWRVGITDFPTEGDAPRRGLPGLFEIQGSILGIFKPKVTYNVDITMYPGLKVNIPDLPPFGCRNVDFKLKWNNPSIKLGFTLIGPGGEAILSILNESRDDNQEMHIDRLGECLEGENYAISVYTLNDVTSPIDFEIEYSWEQEIPKKEGDALTSATEGAILASGLNAPLLYVSSSNLPSSTKNALYKLGVENIYLVNIGKNLKDDVKEGLEDIAGFKKKYVELDEIYDDIREKSGNNDVIFTTIDPWSYYYKAILEEAGETEAGMVIGPAAYIAAHHGSPAIIIDNHPRLSSAAVWHTEYWRRFVANRYEYKPKVAEMYLTGLRIYDFLEDYGFDEVGEETIITVADQYDIGITWDRIFVGVANPGRICGTPVDISCWISRSMFYPALIFENPALQGEVTLTDGSSSSREGLIGLIQKPLLNTLVIKEGGQKEFEYPVLCSFVTHKYRFNERASKYYGSLYQCADGMTPGETTTMQPIDQGVNLKYYGLEGMYFPDMTETEVVPFYLNKGGFETAFSTKLESVAENLNAGVILWIHASHGSQPNGGQTLFWDSKAGFSKHKLFGIFAGAKHEENPWRGYDWQLGSTEEPDTMSMDIKGIIPFTNHNSLFLPAMGMDWALSRKPVREWLIDLPILGNIFEKLFPNVDNLYDGLTGTISYSKYPLVGKNSTQMEALIGNLHSMGFITSICQTSNTYLHLMMIRHGSVFQVQDPWPTSWYGAIWRQSIPRDIILGYTVGEAYSRGISHVGPLYLGGGDDGPQWWWDDGENVVYFGDPDIRMFVPGTEYSDANNWDQEETKALNYDEELSLDGHTPFGAKKYPNEKKEQSFLEKNIFVLTILGLIILLLIALAAIGRKK